MPLSLMDRLPLPNLKAYTAGSVMLLSGAVYYALSVTGDAGWRANSSLPRAPPSPLSPSAPPGPPALDPLALPSNQTRNLTEHFLEVMTFMMQEPLCMWTLINTCYCALALAGAGLAHAVFGRLRVAEAQRLKDNFWNYLFYKFIFVFGVINVQYMDEVLLWCGWFTALGSLQLLAQLCKDRFEYLSFSAGPARWAHVRLAALLAVVTAAAVALLAAAAVYGLPAGRDVFVFMATECVVVLVVTLHVGAGYVLRALNAGAAAAPHYYTNLVFDMAALVVELCHVAHMVVSAQLCVSLASLALLQRLRALLHALHARRARHAAYTRARDHVRDSYPMASAEEMEANCDHCAICWEPMKQARRLPCTHLFHNSCLTRWLQQDASCPTCRRGLPPAAPHPAPLVIRAPPAPPNHLFHFDGSRYVSWLPSFSVEVTRVRLPPPTTSQTDALARQVQQMFPHYSLSVLAADLTHTRSAELTVENILEGRLPPPRDNMPDVTEPSTAHGPRRVDAATSTVGDTPPAPAPHHPASASAPAAALDDWEDPTPLSSPFSADSGEREALLRQRKELLIAAARRRYLQRQTSHS